MKRSTPRSVVEQLARTDLKGAAQLRKSTAPLIRDGELAEGLLRSELLLRYQPIVDLRSGQCRRVEALLRWRHPRLGLLEPADFLFGPHAPSLIEEIGVWVVREAARQWIEWRTRGPALGIGVNLSARELAQAEEFLASIGPLGSGAITFELTSQTLTNSAARSAITRLAASGARIALDGAAAQDAPGRALAAHLDEIKISRALVRRIAEPSALAEMRSLIELARDYRLTSVAVGIEYRATRDLAVALGCDLAQGYFVSRPLVADRLGPWRRWVAGMALTGSLTLTTFAGIGKAAAGGGQQTPALGKGISATACSLDLPDVAARTGIGLVCERADGADIYAEESITPAVRDAIAKAVARDVAKLEQDFGRAFERKPSVYAFATRTSFAFGLQQIFGVRGPDAGLLAVANGGITLPRQGAIVINLQNVPSDKDFAIVRHELTHALVHETIGLDAVLPAWFDEGLATLAERDGSVAAGARSSAVALSILTAGTTALGDLDQQTQWAQQNAALGGQAYSVAAEAVRLVEERVSHDGLMRMLTAMGNGSTFGAAYVNEAGESIADFERSFPSRLAAAQSDARIVQTARADGVLWTLSGFTPDSTVTVAIDGTGYHLEYEVRTDKYGMHQGSFGGTAPKGEYTIRASRSATSATTTIRT